MAGRDSQSPFQGLSLDAPDASEDEVEGDLYIGVKNNYIAGTKKTVRGGDIDQWIEEEPVLPRYKKGDDLAWGFGKSPAEILTMQQMLVDAGLISPGAKFRKATWDEVTRKAYKKLLEFANVNGVDEKEALGQLMEADEVDLSQTKTLQYQLPDKDDIAALVNKSSRSILGRKLDPESLQRIATSYEQELMRLQEKNFQSEAIEGAKLMEMPSPQTFAEEQVRSQNPEEARAHDYSDYYKEFTNLLSESEASVRRTS